jgi:hypothetical protein
MKNENENKNENKMKNKSETRRLEMEIRMLHIGTQFEEGRLAKTSGGKDPQH